MRFSIGLACCLLMTSATWAQSGPPPPGGGSPGSGPRGLSPSFRTFDGTDNNQKNPAWGAAEAPFLRLSPVGYEDGVGSPSGFDRPSARAISNAVVAQPGSILNAAGVSDFVWQWGQFLDHDITLTPVIDPSESFDIVVPSGDIYFDPMGLGTVVIPLERSFYTLESGVREQVNEITAYVDASNVYGSSEELAAELRLLDGTGQLKSSAGELLPFNVNGFPNAPDSSSEFFLAGDFRANEQAALTALHTVFMREHNYWCGEISATNPHFDGDQIYERARQIVGAEMQVITYQEFLPVLLGTGALGPYQGYDPHRDAGISNVFSTASYRFGHSMLSDTLLRLDASGDPIADGHLALASSFFNPGAILDHGVEPLLRGLARQTAQEVDVYLIDGVRNFLFGPPGSGGFDLASLNIQRGRDHGLPSYNQVRIDVGLPPVASFSEVSSDFEVQSRLAAVYDDVDQIDPWVGGLAEDQRPGALVGETVFRVLRRQFRSLRAGDRFWYEVALAPELRMLVEQQTLAGIIRRNTTIENEIGDNVFLVASASGASPFVRGDCDDSGQVDVADAIGLLDMLFHGGATPMCADACDTNDDGQLDLADVVECLDLVFGSATSLAPPYPNCGVDVGLISLGCVDSLACP